MLGLMSHLLGNFIMSIYLIFYKKTFFYYSQKGNVILAGDFNAQFGSKPDFIVCDKKCADIDDIDYIPDQPISRTSQDNVCNARGSLLLDLCKSAGILLANGRLGNDTKHRSYSYYSKNTCSTIDYVISNEYCFPFIDNFIVGDFSMYSDHSPLQFSVKTPHLVDNRNTQTGFF